MGRIAFSVHKEEVEIRTKVKTNKYNSFTATELKNLVQAAQRYEQNAIDRLCDSFKPLILKEAYKSYVVAKLGDDAENTAWEIFLEFIHAYQGNKYRLLPGLVQMHLSYELLHRVYPRTQSMVEAELLLDATDSDGKRIMDPSDKNMCMDGFFEENFFEGLYQGLTPKQRDVIDAVYRHHMSLAEYGQQTGITYTAAYLLEKRALAIIKGSLNKNK